ncbi:hypothetical protein ACSBR2_006140 [Camellia fascicularis]
MNPKDLHSLFGKFGRVRDVFILSKVRKATKSRFGFVRYDCPVAASVAIQKANGLWCDDKALKVKEAEFRRTMITGDKGTASVKGVKGRQDGRDTLMPKRNTSMPIRNLKSSTAGHKSYTEVVQMGQRLTAVRHEITVHEVGNGWLYDSLIVKLKSYLAFSEFKQAILVKGSEEIIIREGGGRTAIVSFTSRAQLEDNHILLKECWQEWCESISEWKKGDHVEQEREVWLGCYGVPFNLWSADTFNRIGRIWGGGN